MERETLLAIALTIGTVIIYLILSKIIDEIFKHIANKKDEIHIGISRGIIKIVLAIAAMIYILSLYITKGMLMTLLASSSIIVAVLGFAAKEALSNVIAGIILVKTKPINIGQRISINDGAIKGEVVGMNLRHTVIRKFNNTNVLVPNSILNNSIIENQSIFDEDIANYIDIIITYDSDIKKTFEIIKSTILESPEYLKHIPVSINVRELTEDGYNIRITVWTHDVDSNFTCCSNARIKLKKLFEENNIKIAAKTIKIIN